MLDFTCSSRPLPKIDRFHSRPLDVHLWSDHPEVRAITEQVYKAIGADQLESDRGKKSKAHYKSQLRILLMDLFVSWLEQPEQAIAFHKDKTAYKVNSRYNKLHISDKIIILAELMVREGYLDEVPGYHDPTGKGQSYCTRIRAAERLVNLFEQSLLDESCIEFNVLKETVILRDGKKKKKKNIEYEDTEGTIRIREDLRAYNNLLQRSSIDIPELPGRTLSYVVGSGEDIGKKKTVSLGPKGKHVHRVFSRGSFEMNGRFSGGFWQQIPRDYRQKIYIDGMATGELDFSGLHVNMLSLQKGVVIEGDPYDLGEVVLDTLDAELQRDAVKSLVLVSINAEDRKKAFAAFRSKNLGTPLAELKDRDLAVLLEAFLAKHPHLDDDLCADKGISLMYKESLMAEEIINYFVELGVPIISIHDSFLVQECRVKELEDKMKEVSLRHLGGVVPVKYKGPAQQVIKRQYRYRLSRHYKTANITNSTTTVNYNQCS